MQNMARAKAENVITNRWVFKIKQKSDGTIDKYKARLVVGGCFQNEGIDYGEIFSPVARCESVRILLSIAAAYNMHIMQFDVKTAFLNGNLEENIYMEQPYGFEIDDRVCHLQKGLYGLKQASRQWNKEIVTFLLDHMFSQSSTDSCVFVYKHDDICIYLALYVDDGLICGNNEKFIDKLLYDLNFNFEITYKVADTFVGLQIERDKDHNLLKIQY